MNLNTSPALLIPLPRPRRLISPFPEERSRKGTESGLPLPDVGQIVGWAICSPLLNQPAVVSQLLAELHPQGDEHGERSIILLLLEMDNVLFMISKYIYETQKQDKEQKPNCCTGFS